MDLVSSNLEGFCEQGLVDSLVYSSPLLGKLESLYPTLFSLSLEEKSYLENCLILNSVLDPHLFSSKGDVVVLEVRVSNDSSFTNPQVSILIELANLEGVDHGSSGVSNLVQNIGLGKGTNGSDLCLVSSKEPSKTISSQYYFKDPTTSYEVELSLDVQ